MNRLLLTTCFVASGLAQRSNAAQLAGLATQGSTPRERVIILADRSGSMGLRTPPETIQSVLLHLVETAALANNDIELMVVTFGEKVTIFAGDDEQPTAAYQSLARKLISEWPDAEAGAGTPLDEAFEKVQAVCTDFDAPTTILLLSDGVANSGRLRPEDFPQIKDLIASKRQSILNRANTEAPEIQAELLRRYDQSLQNSESKEFERLYDKQVVAEQAKTLDHAKTLHQQSIRFITIDFSGSSALKEIHNIAGGNDEDFIQTAPHQVIEQLQEHNLTAMTGVVQLPVQKLAADPDSFERDFVVSTDPLGESVYVALEFQPAIADFGPDSRLNVEVDGQTWEFDPENLSPETTIARDAEGNVATVSIRLPFVPKDHQLRFHWESPEASRSAPALNVYPFLKLREDLIFDFRPTHLPLDQHAPHSVSVSHAVVWKFGVRTQDNTEQFPVATAEAILRSGDDVIRLELAPSSDTPNFVEAKPVALPLGSYDVELHVQLKSGIQSQISLRQHIKSVLRDEAILISLPQASADESLVSSSHSHLDFGLLGDVASERSLEVILQSDQFDGPVAITLNSQLTDSEGNAPVRSWISFSRKNITLFPGRPERVRIKVVIPDQVAATIADGPMEGLVRILAAGRDVELPIKRVEKIAGVAEDAIPNRVTFELKRPQIGVAIPWAMGNWVRGGDDNFHGIVRVDVSRNFWRTVTVEVSHDSAVARSLTVLPQGTIVDRDGRSVPTVRLVPAEGLELTQSIEPGQLGVWTFLFDIDDDCDVPLGIANLEFDGPGLQPLSLPIEIQVRKPLLGAKLVHYGWIGCCISLFVGVLLLRRFLRIRRLETDAEPLVTRNSGLPDVFSLESLPHGKTAIVPRFAMEVVTDEELMRPRILHPEQPFVLRSDEISEGTPLELKIIEGDLDTVIRITGIDLDENGDPEVQVHVIDGGQFDVKCTRLKKAFAVNLLPQVACLLVATGMKDPIVVRRIQWIWDAIYSA